MAWLNRLSNLIGRRDLNPEIDEELQFHVDARIRDNVVAGMSEEEARRDALQRFGSRAGLREQTRDANVVVTLETMTQDLAFAARSLRKRPAFTAVALLTLAVGIGANASIFTIVQGVLLRPLAFAESDRVHVVAYGSTTGPYWLFPGMADTHYLGFRKADRLFESLASFAHAPRTLTGAGDAIRVFGAQVTTDFFRVLRVNPIAGRSFADDDDQPGRDRIALVGHELWRTRFGSSLDLVNKSITLDGVPHTVVGILPAGFAYPPDAQVWTPIEIRSLPNLTLTRPVIGRLRPEIRQTQAQAELDTFVRRLQVGDEERRTWKAQVIPLKYAVAADARQSLLIFAGAVTLVLLIACANVSNLFLMRALSRQQEIATRMALGASRARVVRQLLTESTLLALAGGVAGAFVAVLALPAMLAMVPAGALPRATEIHMDVWSLVFTVGLSLVIGLVVGLAPALQATRGELSGAMKHRWEVGTVRVRRLRHTLVVAEVALAMVLVTGAGLLVRSLVNLWAVNPGFRPEQVVTMTVNLPEARYPSAADLHGFHDRLLASLAMLPDVTDVGSINWQPFGNLLMQGDIQFEGVQQLPKDYNVTKASISPDYFQTMGIRLAAGRDFDARDDTNAPGVAIVSESVARLAWPNEVALGKRLSLETDPGPNDWLTVVAVVDDIRQNSLKQPVVPTVYRPYRQTSRPFFINHASFVVRTAGDPPSVVPALRGALQGVDNDQAPQSTMLLQDAIAGSIAEPRFYTRLLAILSTLALFLAAIGIYGVLASAVTERRREIGIRVALGADQSTVVRMVLGHSMRLAVAGLAIGGAGAVALTGLLKTLLFEVTPTDAATFLGSAAVLLGVALLAGLLPARRATTVDPLVVLRSL
ncbi:MAG TPA: ABC transporter permease [Vicinamibacterales bacterium]|nr:ABC transporter permease [Vicinamibacterales bacterium]